MVKNNSKLTRIKFWKFKELSKFFVLVLLIITFFRPVQIVLENKNYLFSGGYEKKYDEYKKLYYSSQYVKKKNPTIIRDEVVRSFAGGAFLKGLNPILIVHDHPPLGNYMTSASIFLFDNPRTFMIPLLAATLLGLFLLGRLVTGSSLIALIPLAIFANEPLFTNKITIAPLIEPIQFPFILFAFYFFLKGIKEKKYLFWFILTSILLGIIISTRFFVTGGVIVFCMGLFLIYKERKINKKVLTFVLTLPLSLVVLVLSYTKTIMEGYSVIQVLKIQKYILTYHKSKFILPFTFWDLLFFNRWHTWWGNWGVSSDPQWLITWPISAGVSIIYLIMGLIRKIKLNDAEKFLLLWLVIYTLTLSTGYSSTSYFMAIIPFFYILATSLISKTVIFLKGKYKV